MSFFRKSVRLKTVTLAITVVYLGFAKSQLISIVNVFALLEWNLPIFKCSLAWYLLASFTVLSTVLWGRLCCGRLCAFGAMTQLMDRIVPPKWRRELPPRLEHHAVKVKYVVLGGALLYFILTRDRSIYRYVEPFWMFGFHSSRGALDCAWPAAPRHLRQKPLLPISLSGWGCPSSAFQPDRLPDQAVEGVQLVQDLREDVRMGCDSRTEDSRH